MSREPIMVFENEEKLQECIEEWKKVLFLEDWVIKGILVNSLADDNGTELAGQNIFEKVNRTSLIKIRKPDAETDEMITKYCAEQYLVHELLHCKYNWLAYNAEKLESAYYETMEHALLDQMSQSLIMAKYGLDFKWFYNF